MSKVMVSEFLLLDGPGQPGEAERRTERTDSSNPTLVEGRSDERVGTQDPGGEEAGMDTVASSTGTAIAWDRSDAGPLVIVVGGGLQRRATGAARAQLPGQVMVVVLGAWPVRVLAGGPLPTRLAVDEPGLAVHDRRRPLPQGDLAGLAGPGSAGRRDQVEEAGPSAMVLPSGAAAPMASRNLFRREGEYWTVVFDGSVVRLRDAKGLRHLARMLADPGREFHVVDLEAANHQAKSPPAVGPRGWAGAGELAVRPDLGDAGGLVGRHRQGRRPGPAGGTPS